MFHLEHLMYREEYKELVGAIPMGFFLEKTTDCETVEHTNEEKGVV